MNQSVKASIDLHAAAMEALHCFAPCSVHPGCCVVAAGPYIQNGMIPRDRGGTHVVAWKGTYEASEDAARKLVRHYATGQMERDYRARRKTA